MKIWFQKYLLIFVSLSTGLKIKIHKIIALIVGIFLDF